jgi:very-short-patch-repair endonuclease
MRWLSKKDIPTIPAQRPKAGRWVRPFKLKWRDIHILHRRGIQGPSIGLTEMEKRAVGEDVVLGSVEERIVYKELKKRRIPFDFQSSIQGGRLELGGMVADFILLDRPLIIRVQGTKWHTGFWPEHKDALQKAILQAYGYDVVDVWDWQIKDSGVLADWFADNVDVGLPVIGGTLLMGESSTVTA